MPRERKTIDSFEIHVNYGQGWEHECTEFSRPALRENLKAYTADSPWPLKVKRKRIRKDSLEPGELEQIQKEADLIRCTIEGIGDNMTPEHMDHHEEFRPK